MPQYDVIALLENWLGQESIMAIAPGWQGGWERWAQAAWAAYTMISSNGDISASPEQRVYNNANSAADLVFRDVEAGAHHQVPDVVELKCFLASDNYTKFANKLHADFNKLATGASMTAPYSGGNARRWVIGLSVLHDNQTSANIQAALGHVNNFQYHEVHGPNYVTTGIWYIEV